MPRPPDGQVSGSGVVVASAPRGDGNSEAVSGSDGRAVLSGRTRGSISPSASKAESCRIQATLDVAGMRGEVRQVLETSVPAHAVLDAADEVGAELVVAGLRRRTRWPNSSSAGAPDSAAGRELSGARRQGRGGAADRDPIVGYDARPVHADRDQGRESRHQDQDRDQDDNEDPDGHQNRRRRSTFRRTGGGGSVYYANCDAARAAGAAPVRIGDPGYRAGLDRDGDGVGARTVQRCGTGQRRKEGSARHTVRLVFSRRPHVRIGQFRRPGQECMLWTSAQASSPTGIAQRREGDAVALSTGVSCPLDRTKRPPYRREGEETGGQPTPRLRRHTDRCAPGRAP